MTTTTERRDQVIALHGEGKTRQQIADELHISVGGVRYHEVKAGLIAAPKKKQRRGTPVLIAATEIGARSFIDQLGQQLADEHARLTAERDQLDAQAAQIARARDALGLR